MPPQGQHRGRQRAPGHQNLAPRRLGRRSRSTGNCRCQHCDSPFPSPRWPIPGLRGQPGPHPTGVALLTADYPWQMRGFPGKSAPARLVRHSPLVRLPPPPPPPATPAPVVIWRKKSDASDGWDAQVLDLHEQRVNAIAFQPGSTLLASGAGPPPPRRRAGSASGKKAQQATQILEGAPQGFSTLAWSPKRAMARLPVGKRESGWFWKQRNRGRGFWVGG